MSHDYDIAAFRAAIGAIPCEDNPILVRQKSRDFYWYSPILKRELDHVTADLVVTPRNEGGNRRRSRRRATPCGFRSRRAAPAPAITARRCRWRAESCSISLAMDKVKSIAAGPPRQRARRDPRRHRPADAPLGPGIAHASLDLCDRLDRRLCRRRLGRRRLDQLGRPARFRQYPAPARPHHGGRAARAGADRRRSAQGRACLWHQWHHHRSRNAADRRL